MGTLEKIRSGDFNIPMTVSWYLSDIGMAQGMQELFMRQSPQRLKVLQEHAIAESAISSNRIEGVEIDQSRVGTVIFGRPALKDRDEQEVSGYRDALNLIHGRGTGLIVSEETVLELHRLSRGGIGDAGRYKERPVDIIERTPDGRSRIRFRSVSPEETPEYMRQLITRWHDEIRGFRISHLIALAAFNLDFLCIHPFRDGNGRVSRLLLLLTCYHAGLEVGRYISLERLIEQNKERYYETLQQSSHGWHEGRHDAWPYIGYILWIIKTAYDEFAQRVSQIAAPRGTKTELIEAAIGRIKETFTLVSLEAKCPGVSRDMIRKVLKDMQKAGKIKCLGRGPMAPWKKR
jgi:Fic family protein